MLFSEGLLGEYRSPENLASQVANAIDFDVNTQSWSLTTSRTDSSAGAALEARHDYHREQNGVDARGKPRYRTTANHLVLRNTGDATASDVHVTLDPIDGQFHFEQPEPFDLTRKSELQSSLTALRSGNARITMNWTENGETRQENQSMVVS